MCVHFPVFTNYCIVNILIRQESKYLHLPLSLFIVRLINIIGSSNLRKTRHIFITELGVTQRCRKFEID
ncbi:hypothetical protein TWF128_004964 [Orbilia oligospora]|nr:hypothetical protein TWF128_004964 [Orbilia oligospora]